MGASNPCCRLTRSMDFLRASACFAGSKMTSGSFATDWYSNSSDTGSNEAATSISPDIRTFFQALAAVFY